MATAQALYSQNSTQGGSTLATAWPNPSGVVLNLDLLQIVDLGGLCVLNVDSTGAVHNPSSSPTNGTRIGVFQTKLASGDTTAHYFADAFANPSALDIFQAINLGGNIHYNLTSAGVAVGS